MVLLVIVPFLFFFSFLLIIAVLIESNYFDQFDSVTNAVGLFLYNGFVKENWAMLFLDLTHLSRIW